MNERQEFLRKTLVPCVVTTTVGVTATLLVKGDNARAGAALAVLTVLLGLYALFLWINPRLGYLPWLWLRQWQLIVGLLLLAVVTIWLIRVTVRRRWLISASNDTVILLWMTVIAVMMASYGISQLVPLLRPRAMPADAGRVELSFTGKTEDRTGRGSPAPDGHPDAEFNLAFQLGSSAERRSVVLIVLQRVSSTGRRFGQVWTSESLPSLWTLSVVDATTNVLLNPDGHMTFGSVQNGTVLRLFASDKSDDSDWFVDGQFYTATAYLDGNLRMTATAATSRGC